jgi:GR25 family glycosyltransferase involved in LPS biosynthesis
MNFKAFIINLERNPERLAFMTSELDKLGISFERFNAFDGSKYDFSYDYDEDLYKSKNKGTTATNGVKGCALSHRKVLEKMIAENLDYALVFEDDIELRDDFGQIIKKELQRRESGKTRWEYLSFNYPSVGYKSIHLWLFLFNEQAKREKWSLKFISKLPIYLIKFLGVSTLYLLEGLRESIFKLIYKHGKPTFFLRSLYLAGCYMINQSGARKLIDLNTKIAYTADGLPNAARLKRGLKFLAYVPLVARQKREEFESTLNNDHFGKKVITY